MLDDGERDPRLIDAVSQLRDTPPAHDLWPAISRQLRPRGTLIIRWPTALAAGVALMICTAAATAVIVRHGAVTQIPATAVAAKPGPATTDSNAVTPTTASYSADDAVLATAVDQVERAVRSNLGRLDPEARTSVEQSLAVLDQAIAQASARRHADPNDPHVARFLTSTLRKKLQLLRTVRELTQSRS